MTENTDPNSSENRASTKTDTAADSFDDLREQFDDECVLHGLSRAREIDPDNPPTVYFLDEDTGRVYRVLDATRGSPDSGWFVLALAGPHADDPYERQLRVHDSDTHRILVGNEIDEWNSRTAMYHCEVCGAQQTHDEYVAVGPSTPAARHLELEDSDGDRDHFVVCDSCFEKAAAEIAGKLNER
jgi:hypothetical protein